MGNGFAQLLLRPHGLNFVSTAITDVVVSGPMTAVTGTGTVNGTPEYRFTAMFLDNGGSGNRGSENGGSAHGGSGTFGMTILNPDGTTYYSADPQPITGDALTVSTP